VIRVVLTQPHLITPARLGRIEGGIGQADQYCQVLTDDLGQGAGSFSGGFWQDDHKLLTIITAHPIRWALEVGLNDLRHLLQDGITALMARVIVDGFEMINVQHQH
jgi:hypothetical protein